jgi:hypothetical protein
MKLDAKKRKNSIDRNESFDELLAKEGLLTETEEAAIRDIVADRSKLIPKKKS